VAHTQQFRPTTIKQAVLLPHNINTQKERKVSSYIAHTH